jgi:hypothetical protein
MLTVGLVALLTANAAFAQRATRIDSGPDWFNSDSFTTAQTVSTGLGVDFLGFSLSQLTINLDGSVSLGNAATISPYQTTLPTGPMSISYSVNPAPEVATNLPPGIVAGFRANWSYGTGVDNFPPDNLFQLSLYQLSDGTNSSLALEFNYESINAAVFGSEPVIGYSAGANQMDLGSVLASALGGSTPPLTFADYKGVGLKNVPSDDGVTFLNYTNLCPIATQPNALVCNNYYSVTNTFGPGDAVLPSSFNNYFSVGQTFLQPVIGRYLFILPATATDTGGGGTTTVPEPDSALLFAGGLLSLLLARMRRRAV